MTDSKEKHRDKYIRLGLNVAVQRKLRNMTQMELPEAINISRTHMSNIEAPNSLSVFEIKQYKTFGISSFEWTGSEWNGVTVFVTDANDYAGREIYFQKQRKGKLVYEKKNKKK